MRPLRTPWVELRRERDGARVMETAVSYPGVKNCTAQRAMYIERPRVAEKRAYLALKRAFDISGALVGLAVLALPMSVIALIIALDSPGDPIFRQERLGKDGKPFTIYKFRTMYTYAPEDVATNSIDVSAYTTGAGKFLRGYSIDELPQLWNVLRGDMSFVGYRPVCLSEQQLNRLRLECGVLDMRPGITGYAQVNGRDNVTMNEKVRLDQYYAQHCSFSLDLHCLLKTVKVALSKEGAK